MKLRNRLFLAFFMFAFLPVAAISFIGLELALDSLDRIASPGIESALAAADSLAAVSLAGLERRCLDLIQAPGHGYSVEHFERFGFDFALIAIGSDTALTVFDPATDSVLKSHYHRLSQLLCSKGTTGRAAMGDDMLVFGISASGDTVAMAGFVPGSGYNALHSRFGAHMQRFDQLKLLKTSGKRFMRVIWAVASIAYLLAIVLVTRITARSLTRPLSKLGDLVERVGPGNWNVSLEYGRKDEIGLLVSGFNRMSERLSETTRKLIETEKTAAWEQTARVIAHGIKNILAPVKLAVARLSQRIDAADSEMISPLETIQVELALLERIARDFSIFGRPVEGELTDVNLNLVARQAAEVCEAGCSGVDLVLSLSDGVPRVAGDDNLLREAMINLIKNACEAAGDGGRVTVSTAVTADGAAVSISDTGGGIDGRIRESLFDPYVTTKPGGTGLGLAIACKIVVSMGGKISFETGSGGTTFSLSFKVNHERHAD